jgi:acyl carrier protein
MSDPETLQLEIFKDIQSRLSGRQIEVTENTPLIGDLSCLDSIQLVELCLALEDKASELGFTFDWTSEAAMSKSRGMFRTAGALAKEFLAQRESQK